MANYEANLGSFSEGRTYRYEGMSGRPALFGTVTVEPPINVGEGFNSAVLGKEQNGVSMTHVVSTQEASVFVVEASLYDRPTHEDMLNRVRERIAHLANNPANAAEMSLENPFPDPSEW